MSTLLSRSILVSRAMSNLPSFNVLYLSVCLSQLGSVSGGVGMHDVRSINTPYKNLPHVILCARLCRAQIVRDFVLAGHTAIGLAKCQRKFAQAIIHAADTPEHVGASREVCRKYCAFSLGFQ